MSDSHTSLHGPVIIRQGTSATKRLLMWIVIAALLLLFTYSIRSILLPFVIGIAAAYFLDPAADRLETAGMKRGMATTVITAIFFTLIATVIVLVVPVILRQGADLIMAAPDYLAGLQQRYSVYVESWIRRIDPEQVSVFKKNLGEAGGGLVTFIGGLLTGVVHSSMAVFNVLSLLLITPLVTFYLLRDWDGITNRLDALLPLPYADTIREQLAIIDTTLAGFIRGQMNVCLIQAFYYATLLSVIGLPFGLVIGIATGFLVILPYVGVLFGFITALGIAIVQFGFAWQLWALLAIFGVAQLLEGYYLVPKLVGDRVGLHPLWIIFGMLAGAALLGFVGILLAVPLTAVIGVLIRFAIQRYMESTLYKGV